MDYDGLVKLAYEAAENAYAPYSNFKVGAALLTKSGKVYTGCNVECASYGGTNCAERTALFKAISEGEREFVAIAVVNSNHDYTYPCGICRQVLSEFGTEFDIIMNGSEGNRVYKLSELLPFTFTKLELDK